MLRVFEMSMPELFVGMIVSAHHRVIAFTVLLLPSLNSLFGSRLTGAQTMKLFDSVRIFLDIGLIPVAHFFGVFALIFSNTGFVELGVFPVSCKLLLRMALFAIGPVS